jgi:carbon monoxide dehydrogenase subunit G
MFQLSGEEHFSQAQNTVWARLTDVEWLVKCLPDVEDVARDQSGSLVCRVRPGLSFVKGTLKVTLDILDERAPDAVRIRIHSKGIGASALVETAVELSSVDSGTRLDWSAEVKELGGLLQPVSRDLVAAAARKVIAQGWTEFRNQLGETPD